MTSRPVTVLIADDHASVRAGLRLLLETAEDVVVVGEAADGEATIVQERALRPDVVLMDARMPRLDGIEATRRIVAAGGSADVLVLTTFDVDEVVFGALRAGAAGFLLKSAEPEEVIGAIRRVAAGDGVVAPEVTRRLLAAFIAGPGATDDGAAGAGAAAGSGSRAGPGSGTGVDVDPLPASLTPREVDVLAALGRGLSNVEIAEELTVSLATVKTHVSHVLEKTGSTGRMQAAVLARRAGLA